MPPQADRRAELLLRLERLNAALGRHHAVLDVTDEEAAGIREIRTLEHIVDAVARRLAALIEAGG